MARLFDLPPEVRLEIYRLLLVDPIREELSIAFFFDKHDGYKIIRESSRCMQVTMPHEEAHIPRIYRIPHYSTSLHHLDFTDLMSLAMTNKTLYAEASQTIYDNANLTLYLKEWPRASFPLAFRLITRYLERHGSSTREMIRSLVIHDRSAVMSPKHARSVVDLVNTQLPNLRAFEYHVLSYGVMSSRGLLNTLQHRFRCAHSRAVKAVQPFVGLTAAFRTTFNLAVPKKLALRDPRLYSELCELSQQFAEKALEMSGQVHKSRRAIREHHELALHRGLILHVTLALRSLPNTDTQLEKDTPRFEEMLGVMHTFDITFNAHHEMLRAARTSS
jgi:hypothetical protein